MKRKVIAVLVVFAALYGLLCLAVYLLQDGMVFPGAYFGRRVSDDPNAPANVQVSTLTSGRGDTYRIAVGMPEGKPHAVLAFFVGNGADLRSGVRSAALFAEYGCVTLVTEYPGYGASGGKPGVEAVFSAARTSATEAQRIAGEIDVPLIVAGQSLGTFSAAHLAAEGFGSKLLLISPPTSASAIGNTRFPFLPIGLLLRHRFDSLSAAPKIKIPTLVLHGDADTVVPVRFGRELAAAIPGARFQELHGLGHNNINLTAAGPLGADIARFIGN